MSSKNPFKESSIKKLKSIGSVPTYLKIAADLKINLALCGAHGRAKTSIIKQYAEENGYELISIILSRLTPEDMIGLPTTKTINGKKVTAFSNPDWLVSACDKNKKVVLFFDEFTNAEVDTQASILDLIESREANGLVLNEDTQIIMAYNPPSIAPNGRRLSKATRDRICVIPLLDHSSKNSYADYFRSNNMDVLANIVVDTEDIIPNYDDSVEEEAYDNAEFTFRSLEKSYKIVRYCIENKIKNAESISSVMVCGYGGSSGKAVCKRIFEGIKSASKDEKLHSTYVKAYSSEGIGGVIREFSSNEFPNGFAEIKQNVDIIKGIVHPIEFQKLLNECTTNEFVSLYNNGGVVD